MAERAGGLRARLRRKRRERTRWYPFLVSPYWLGNAERWEWYRKSLMRERGITEADISCRYVTCDDDEDESVPLGPD